MNGTRLVAAEELRDMWLRGRSGWVAFGVAVALGIAAVAISATAQINLLEAREGLTVLVKLTLGAGLGIVLLTAADSISGERDRGTLESLLLTPLPGRSLVIGKLVAAWSWGVVLFLVSIPFLVVVGDSIGLRARGVAAGALLGVVMTPLVGAVGSLFSVRAATNLTSIAWSLLTVLAVASPAFLPGRVMSGPIGTAVLAVDPLTAGLSFLDRALIADESFATALPLLISPVAWAFAVGVLLVRSTRRLGLDPAP